MVGNDVGGLAVNLQTSLAESEIKTIQPSEVAKAADLPDYLPLEIIAATQELPEEEFPLAGNATYKALVEEKWHLQDFLPADQQELDCTPGADIMKMLRWSKRLKLAAALVFLGVLSWSGYKIWERLRSEAWVFSSAKNKAVAAALGKEVRRFEKWDNLLKDRSKAWASMELIARLAPEDDSVIFRDVKHVVSSKSDGEAKSRRRALPRRRPKFGGVFPASVPTKGEFFGIQKTWEITGYSTDAGLEHLEKVSSREGIKKVFADVAKATGNAAFLPNVDKRDITVNLKQRNNDNYQKKNAPDSSNQYRRAFTLTITQTLSNTDALALSLCKKPFLICPVFATNKLVCP